MKWWWLGACVLGIGFGAGCSTLPPEVGTPPPQVQNAHEEVAYQKLVSRYSDHQEIYLGFDTVMFAATTFQSPRFRKARLERKAEFQKWPASVLQVHLAEARQAAASTIEFFFGVHMDNPHFDDFDRPDSIWRIALVTPSGQVVPSKVARIGRADIRMRAYYRYMGDFWVAYRIDFPVTLPNGKPTIPPGTKSLLLKVASALGTAEFHVAAQ